MVQSVSRVADDSVLVGNEDAAVPVARAVVALSFEQLDGPTIEAAKKLTLDVLGAGVAGAFEPGCVEVRESMADWGGKPEASLIQSGGRVPAQSAVAANSTTCRALETDDVSERALIHTTATIVPVALAAAESQRRPVSGRELLTAISAGIDVANRLSLAPRHSVAGAGYKPRGMSYTYQIGTFAAAATWAKIAGADAPTMLHALGMAYSQAAGNQQCLLDGALAVRVQQGLSASNGVIAARLALSGVTAPIHPLEGRFGYYPIYCNGDYDRSAILDGLGTRITVTDVSIKPYPCCKYTHTTVAAAIEARARPGFSIDQIERVVAHVDNAEYYSVVCNPIEEKRRPRTPIGAQFSLPYCVAVGLCRGEVLLSDFRPEALDDTEVLAVAAKIEAVVGIPEGGVERRFPTPGIIELHLRNGTVIQARADYAPGHPKRPMSWDEMVTKFRRNVAFPVRPLPTEKADALVERIRSLEELSDVRSLVANHLVW